MGKLVVVEVRIDPGGEKSVELICVTSRLVAVSAGMRMLYASNTAHFVTQPLLLISKPLLLF